MLYDYMKLVGAVNKMVDINGLSSHYTSSHSTILYYIFATLRYPPVTGEAAWWG